MTNQSDSKKGTPLVLPSRSMLVDPELERQLRRDGFVVVDVLGPSEVSAALATVDELYPGGGGGFHSSLMSSDLEYRRSVFETIPPLFESFAAETFEDYEPFAASLTLKWPGEEGALDAHQDYSMVDEREYRSLNIWCTLVDTTPTNGALSVLRGSHLVLDHLRCGPANPASFQMEATEVTHDEMEMVCLKAGQGIIFDHALLHGSTANLSEEFRPTVTVAYRPAEAQLLHYHVPEPYLGEVEVHEVDPEFFQRLEIGAAPAGDPARLESYRGTPRDKDEILELCAATVSMKGDSDAMNSQTFLDPELESSFRRDGFVIVDLLDAREVVAAQSVVDELFRGGSEGFHGTNMLPQPDYRRSVWEGLRPVLEEKSQALLSDHEACTAALMIKFPDENSGFVAHQDWSLVDESRFRSVNVWCPLVDTNEGNGALRVLPGSHAVLEAVRCSPAPPSEHSPPGWEVPLSDLEPLTVKAGQAVIFDHAILHGSEPNASGEVRPAITLAMKPKGADLVHWFVPDLSKDEMSAYRIDSDYLADFELGLAPEYPLVGNARYVPDALTPAEIVEKSRRAVGVGRREDCEPSQLASAVKAVGPRSESTARRGVNAAARWWRNRQARSA